MTPDDYRRAFTALGFSGPQDVGRWIGINPRTAQAYGHDGPSPPVEKLILTVLALGLTPDEVDRRIRAYQAGAGPS